MNLKLYQVVRSKLSNVPTVSGQIICTSDITGLYYDMGDIRHGLQPADAVLYSLIPESSTTASGYSGTIDCTVDSGILDVTRLNRTEFKSLEFVFYDTLSQTQFSGILYGLPFGSNGLYTYNTFDKIRATLDLDNTDYTSSTDNSIRKETLYVSGTVSVDGSFAITSKTSISEITEGNQSSITSSNIVSENRVALLMVIGRG